MKLETIKYNTALNSAYFKQSLKEESINLFKTNFERLFERINEAESEEHNKNIVSQFLHDTFYKNDYEINTAGRKDLVIHKGSTANSPVAIIIEAKSPTNKNEMISFDKPNVKALHETIHYFLHERIVKQNNDIKHIIITNIYDWFIFDAQDFEKYFYTNKNFRNQYQDWNDKKLLGMTTDWFYNEIAKPFVEQKIAKLECVYVNLSDFKKLTALDNNLEEDNKLINLYKLFSPQHLLKLPYTNDYNKIDTGFYNELLYILGLEETKVGGKKLIKRAKEKNRKVASLLEITIGFMEQRNRLKSIERIDLYGITAEEQIFSIALELCITWLNRILFLKLLESQLIKYHKFSKVSENYAFLNKTNIKDFDELDELFFEVLAKKPETRTSSVNEKFGNLPYLNSSLFEETELEQKVICASQLKDRLLLPFFQHSVLKQSEKFKNTLQLNTLEYIFEFLNAYNFASDMKAEIQNDNRTIINAAVLGLIFEKINGYKDGSFYTPSSITSFMSREILKSSIIHKFRNSNFSIFKNLKNFDELKDKIDYSDKEQRQKANEIINSIKICDPAVGSGHFLVSILNEIVALKSELKILQYPNGNRIKGIKITNNNDELEIIQEETGEPFQYYINDKHQPITEIQELQEALFNEKRTLIEKCLFGVDINPKSVLICRLRLWIELLKNSYYNFQNIETALALPFPELETLPNIDINIKNGNSLINFFDFNGNGFKNGQLLNLQKFTKEYKTQVELYKNTSEKLAKDKIVEQIKQIRTKFVDFANPNDKEYQIINEKVAEQTTQFIFFNKQEQVEWNIKQQNLKVEIENLQINFEKKRKHLYKNAFEWRFEFPEVLDDNGKFVGFDIIIGNPPYGVLLSDYEKTYFNEKYLLQDYQLDTYLLFLERVFKLIVPNGFIGFIIPNTWLTNLKFKKIRQFVTEQTQILGIAHYSKYVFSEAIVDTQVLLLQKNENNNSDFNLRIYKTEDIFTDFVKNQKELHTQGETINIFLTKEQKAIFEKVTQNSTPLNDIVNLVVGAKPYEIGKGKPTQDEKMVKERIYDANYKVDSTYRTLLRGKDINKYTIKWKGDRWIKYGINLAAPRKQSTFDAKQKIVIRQTGDKLIAALDTKQFICMNNLHVITLKNNIIRLKYLLALLNSKLLDFYHQCLNPEKGEALAEIKKENVGKLPIKFTDKKTENKIIKLVDGILTAKNTSEEADTSEAENQIDKLIFSIYELSEKEINVIENVFFSK